MTRKTERTPEEIEELKKWGFKPENHPVFLTLSDLLADRPWLTEYRVCRRST